MVYEIIGKVSIILAISILLLLLVSLFLGVLVVKKKKLVLPKLLLFTVDTFYFQLKKLAKKFGLGERIVDIVGIEVRNNLSFKKFAKIKPKDRILIVPQCLRHAKCPARLDSMTGIACKECGLCILKDLKAEAERLGYGFYIVPGGRFVQRIVKAVRPKAALGVACTKDLNLAMHELANCKTIVQGVPLVKDGCVQTQVNVEELLRRLRAGVAEVEEKLGKQGCIDDTPRAGTS
jgi:hypothetical protein